MTEETLRLVQYWSKLSGSNKANIFKSGALIALHAPHILVWQSVVVEREIKFHWILDEDFWYGNQRVVIWIKILTTICYLSMVNYIFLLLALFFLSHTYLSWIVTKAASLRQLSRIVIVHLNVRHKNSLCVGPVWWFLVISLWLTSRAHSV